MTLPPLPAIIQSQLGPVPVEMVDALESSHDEDCWGLWCPGERKVKIRTGLHPIMAWATLWHETIHVWLWDAGTGLEVADEERVCDGLSSMLVAQMLASEHVDVGSVREA